MAKPYAEKPQVLAAAEILKSGACGTTIRRGEIIRGDAPARPIQEIDVIQLRVDFETQGRGILGRRTMWAAIRLAEGYAPEEIWKVKRRGT